jgi:phospholipid transport system transporter-binding protein
MIALAGDCARVSGRLVIDEAAATFEEGRALIANGVFSFDLSGVVEADSSALAVIFGWQREARRQQGVAVFANPPGSLASLAEVYGVSDLLAAK